jgi:hypothetical protein
MSSLRNALDVTDGVPDLHIYSNQMVVLIGVCKNDVHFATSLYGHIISVNPSIKEQA